MGRAPGKVTGVMVVVDGDCPVVPPGRLEPLFRPAGDPGGGFKDPDDGGAEGAGIGHGPVGPEDVIRR